jgi:P pilus assembly chaperone PapD
MQGAVSGPLHFSGGSLRFFPLIKIRRIALRLGILSLLWICLLIVSPVRAAFSIEPAVVTFLADKGEKTAFVEIVHTGGGPAAIQLSVLERKLDIDGKLIEEGLSKNSDFLVHPAQVILTPKERAVVQIQYKVKGKVTADRAYALFSQEVPLDVDDEDEGGVNMSVKMLTNYYTVISLETGKPGKLVFVSSKAIGGGKIEVVAENKGGGRISMRDFYIVINGALIKEFTGKGNSIMPGQSRRFIFEWPKPLTDKEVKFVY